MTTGRKQESAWQEAKPVAHAAASPVLDVLDSPSPDVAWEAVLARDARFDGRFVYAVSTTGVYCRPVCAARRPHRRNVNFFPSASAAEQAGYRACRRCRPATGGPSSAVRSIERVRDHLDRHVDEHITLEQLGRIAHMSPFHLQRTFKQMLGVSPRQYTLARRAERLKRHLRDGDSVSSAQYRAGYGSSSRLYEQADAWLGMTPATYGRGGQGMRIRFTTRTTPLGCVLVAATERGVCAVTLGDSAAQLERALRSEYPRAHVQRSANELEAWVDTIMNCLAGSTAAADLPLDVQATAFQWRVWNALRQIPRGATRSYAELAAAIGEPTAVRAVARACASNRIAAVIPCHRVVRKDGQPGGYRWGMERKRKLLELEASISARRPAD